MPISDERNREQVEGTIACAARNPADPYATAELTPRCIRCNAPAPNAVCGRKTPCAACGFPYPLGDCSDLAEN